MSGTRHDSLWRRSKAFRVWAFASIFWMLGEVLYVVFVAPYSDHEFGCGGRMGPKCGLFQYHLRDDLHMRPPHPNSWSLEEERKLHEEIMTLRNKGVAHAEWSHHPTGVSDSGIIKAMPFSIWLYFNGSPERTTSGTRGSEGWEEPFFSLLENGLRRR